MRRPWARLAGVMGAGLVLLATPAMALAHANLARSDPPMNADLQAAPAQVQLWFTERPELILTTVQVYNEQRQRVDQGPATVAPGDSLSLVERLQPSLPRGTYTVSWHTTSAEDGHVTGGAFAFGVGVKPSPTAALAQPPPAGSSQGPLSMAIRWLSYLAAAGLLGLILFPVAVLRPALAALDRPMLSQWELAEQTNVRCQRAARLFAILAVVAAMATIFDQVARSGGQLTTQATSATLSTNLGRLLLARNGVALALLAVLSLRHSDVTPSVMPSYRSLGAAAAAHFRVMPARTARREVAAIGFALAQLLLFALTSHAMAVPNATDVALFVDWLHLSLAGFWVGGLIALALAVVPVAGSWLRLRAKPGPADLERNGFFGPVISQFSRLALVAALGLAITGVYQAILHVGTINQIASTDYGRALAVKTAIFAGALALAGYHRLVLVPASQDPTNAVATRARRFFTRSLPAEAFLGVAVLAAVGVLTSLAPANSQVGNAAMTKDVGNVQVAFQVLPMQIGSNAFQVTLRSNGQPVANADKVEMVFNMLDMQMGQTVVDLRNSGHGTYSAQSDALSMGGHWRVDMLLRLPGQFDKRTSFDLTVKA